jgi:hypothetical protein
MIMAIIGRSAVPGFGNPPWLRLRQQKLMCSLLLAMGLLAAAVAGQIARIQIPSTIGVSPP